MYERGGPWICRSLQQLFCVLLLGDRKPCRGRKLTNAFGLRGLISRLGRICLLSYLAALTLCMHLFSLLCGKSLQFRVRLNVCHTLNIDLFSAIKLLPCSELTFPSSAVSFYGFALCVLLPLGLVCSKIFPLTVASTFEMT